MADMDLSAPVHYDALVVLELMDVDWLSMKLPIEDVDVPITALGPVDDDDGTGGGVVGGIAEEEDDLLEKWGDYNLPV